MIKKIKVLKVFATSNIIFFPKIRLIHTFYIIVTIFYIEIFTFKKKNVTN